MLYQCNPNKAHHFARFACRTHCYAVRPCARRYLEKQSMRIIALTFLVLWTSLSNANGSDLLQSCKSALNRAEDRSKDTSAFESGYCIGSVQGMRNMNSAYGFKLEEVKGSKVEPFFCIPPEERTHDIIKELVWYMEEFPSDLTHHKGMLMIRAFSVTYPCSS